MFFFYRKKRIRGSPDGTHGPLGVFHHPFPESSLSSKALQQSDIPLRIILLASPLFNATWFSMSTYRIKDHSHAIMNYRRINWQQTTCRNHTHSTNQSISTSEWLVDSPTTWPEFVLYKLLWWASVPLTFLLGAVFNGHWADHRTHFSLIQGCYYYSTMTGTYSVWYPTMYGVQECICTYVPAARDAMQAKDLHFLYCFRPFKLEKK